MGAEKPNGVVNYCRRPPHRPLLQRLRYCVWNPEEGTVLGRTPHRWGGGPAEKYASYTDLQLKYIFALIKVGVIGLIYLVMYICIIIFFSLCMCGLLATVDDRVPYFTLADSIIGDNPGMGHRPLLFEEGALIWFDGDNETQIAKYVDNINQFLAPYENKSLLVNQGVNQIECGTLKPPREQVCGFDVKQLGPCSKENKFGYADRKPCLIIKLNKIYDWKPDFYDDPGDLPLDMPPDILKYINSTTTQQQRRKVWVSCQGERPADVEALGPLTYWPYPGLDETFFPYDNTPGYLSPIVAVRLESPALHQIINIRCRAWARNVIYSVSLKDRLGSTHLEIMVD